MSVTQTQVTTPDQDMKKGATEDERPTKGTNAPGLDGEGLPNDKKKIAEDGAAARADKTQG